MRLYIRDDDTSYFTRPEELQQAYGDVWHKGPVSIAVIPFDVPTEGRGDIRIFKQDASREFPVGRNRALVDFIKDKMKENKLYIMLHGYNHVYDMSDPVRFPFGIPEFVYRKSPFEYIKKGKDYLEEVFGQEIKWFVPPSNSMSQEAIDSCGKLGLNIATSIGLGARKKSLTAVFNYFYIRYAKSKRLAPVLTYGDHYELLTTNFNKVSDFARIRYLYPKDKLIIATHYWEINQHDVIKSEILNYIEKVEKIFPIDKAVTDHD